MLLKTNLEKMSVLGLAIISMKIKGLFYLAIMYMKINGLSSKRSPKTEMASAPKTALVLSLGRFNHRLEG